MPWEGKCPANSKKKNVLHVHSCFLTISFLLQECQVYRKFKFRNNTSHSWFWAAVCEWLFSVLLIICTACVFGFIQMEVSSLIFFRFALYFEMCTGKGQTLFPVVKLFIRYFLIFNATCVLYSDIIMHLTPPLPLQLKIFYSKIKKN